MKLALRRDVSFELAPRECDTHRNPCRFQFKTFDRLLKALIVSPTTLQGKLQHQVLASGSPAPRIHDGTPRPRGGVDQAPGGI